MLSLKLSVGDRFSFKRMTAFFIPFLLIIGALLDAPVEAAPVPVLFPEGFTHGFLLVRSLDGETVGEGELIQTVKEKERVESRLIFRFKDGSVHEEKVVFAQQHLFRMVSYHLIQRGPAFSEQVDVSVDRNTARYKIRSQTGKEGKEEERTGEVDLPEDAYNGMLITVLKNIPKSSDETVSILAFTPAPEVIRLRLHWVGEQTVRIGGDLSKKAMEYTFEPQIGKIKQFFGRLFGKLPADFHYRCAILADEAPSFVELEAPLQLLGPVFRFELVSPQLSTKTSPK
ncbi:MAG: hypothetical protein HY282_04360 [Nitrospirae bacterium]|nr:hypothetical protein [Candidatus Manganitrophaceae bacterium]